MLGTFDLTDLTVFFRLIDLNIRHCLLVFCDKFISSSTFVLDKSITCSNSLSYGVTHSLNYIIKQIVLQQSITDRYLHK